jgi:transketolase N-terminal domain/subunit
MQTGVAYESLRTAARTPDVRLTVVVDWNGSQCSGPLQDGDRLPSLFGALGLPVHIVDGHDVPELRRSLRAAPPSGATVLLARTVPCHGLPGLAGLGEIYGEQLDPTMLERGRHGA